VIDAVAFEPGHLAGFAADAVFASDRHDREAASVAAGPAWTLRLDGRPVACGGIVLLWRGVGEAWSLSASGLGGRALAVHRLVAERLAAAEREHGLHRIQASVHIDNRRGRRWVAALGFEEEGIMKAYGPAGDDFVRVARRRPA